MLAASPSFLWEQQKLLPYLWLSWDERHAAILEIERIFHVSLSRNAFYDALLEECSPHKHKVDSHGDFSVFEEVCSVKLLWVVKSKKEFNPNTPGTKLFLPVSFFPNFVPAQGWIIGYQFETNILPEENLKGWFQAKDVVIETTHTVNDTLEATNVWISSAIQVVEPIAKLDARFWENIDTYYAQPELPYDDEFIKTVRSHFGRRLPSVYVYALADWFPDKKRWDHFVRTIFSLRWR